MDITKKSVFKALEQLEEEEFNQFKWHLWNGVIKDISPISRGKLEKIKCHGVVDLMVQKYSADAGKIAVQVLRNMEQNELAHRLELNFQKVQQPVLEEARNAPESMQPIQSDWLRAYNITACSQQFKQRLLREKGNDVYIPTSRSQRKGSALLITNIKFDHSSHRNGAEIDEENMEWLLRALGYSVEKHTNLSGDEIDGKVKNFSKRYEHRDSDSTFVVIMSHGERIQNKDAILGVHYDPDLHPDDYVFVENIFFHLNSVNCPALIDKPKVILIQACRGGDDGGVYVSDSVFESDSWVHKEKDFVCFRSSLPDTVSYRDPDSGSYFIRYIVDVFSTCAHNDDIMELFRKVASRMENDPRFTEEEKLLPCIERMSLVRKFYLFPGL